MSFTPSKYQQDIFDWALNGRGDAFVSAVAGSGKSTTLVELSKRLRTNDALFLAFNKSIVEELTVRLGPGFTAKTLNGLGHGALMRGLGKKKLTLSNNKYGNILFESIKNMVPQEKISETLRVMKNLVSFAMSNMADGSDESLLEIVEHYGLELPSKLSDKDCFNLVRSTLATGEAMGKQGTICYDDQIYLPVKWKMYPIKSGFVMIDECQDLSRAKLQLTLMAGASGGRMLFVGDEKQAIYSFAGADARSVPNIIAATNATVFPLSVSYRCPKAVVEHAKKIVPVIEAAPNAQEGVVEYIKEAQMVKAVKNGDLVLCRLTAPLVGLCIKLIKQRIPARVRGRDIGKQLVALAKEALGSRPWNELDAALDDYLEMSLTKLLTRKNHESAVQTLNDKIDGVRACADGFNVNSFAAFETNVEGIFSDENAMVDLCSIHRAKGLEANDVYIICPEKLPLIYKNQQDWQREQEDNLDYVARTRAKHGLYYVETEK